MTTLASPDSALLDGSEEEWVQIHKKRLAEAFSQAGLNLEAAADERKKRHDAGARFDRLSMNDRVLLRDHPPGRNKIQDAWKKEVFQVVGVPSKAGQPYVIQSAEGEYKVVNRAELKRCWYSPNSTERIELPSVMVPQSPKSVGTSEKSSQTAAESEGDEGRTRSVHFGVRSRSTPLTSPESGQRGTTFNRLPPVTEQVESSSDGEETPPVMTTRRSARTTSHR